MLFESSMNRTILCATLFSCCAAAWACSSSDHAGAIPTETDTETPATIPAETTAEEPASSSDTNDADDGGAIALDAMAPDAADGGNKTDAGAKPDAGPDIGPIGCVNEKEPNDGQRQQMPRSLCGTLTAGDLDRFYIEGRKDESIDVIFSADGDALVTFATNAGLSEVYFAKSFRTTVKPGDRKLLIDIGLAPGPVAYHVAFARK